MEQSPLLLLERQTSSASSSSSSSSRKTNVLKGVLIGAALCSTAALCTISSNKGRAYELGVSRQRLEERDQFNAADLGTELPKRTWTKPLVVTAVQEAAAAVVVGDQQQQQQQQQKEQEQRKDGEIDQQQGNRLKPRVWQKSPNELKKEEEHEKEQNQSVSQQQQQQSDEKKSDSVLPKQEEEKAEADSTAAKPEELANANANANKEEDQQQEQQQQPVAQWRVNMQNIAKSASDALKQEVVIIEPEDVEEVLLLDTTHTTATTTTPQSQPQQQQQQQQQQNAVPGVMENLYDIDHDRYEGEQVRVPFSFFKGTKWVGADFWKHDWNTPNMSDEQKAQPDENKFMPVFKTHGVDSADVVITAHATSIHSLGWVIMDSAKQNGLQIVISGNGTDFHGFADKMMGLKAALHSINGNPIVINADANDVLLQCGAQEFKKRFEQANADFIFGGETQLWPEIHAYFGKTEEIAWKEKMSDTLGNIGAGVGVDVPGNHPNVWANAGSFMARKNDMIKYIEETEGRMARHANAQPGEWAMTCRPAGVTDQDFADINGSGWVNWFDDQECLTSFQMRHLMERSTRHKLDADGSILFSAGGTPMDQIGQDKNGMVYHKETGKASCLWHFNNPQAKIRLKDFANAFPSKFLTKHGHEVMLASPDEHPGNRDLPSSAAAVSARAEAMSTSTSSSNKKK